MAQVMNYYQHPNKGWGTEYYISNYGEMFGNFEHYYNWDSLNLSELLFDCDRSVHSEFSTFMQAWQCGTITLNTLNQALHEHFGYKLGTIIIEDLDSLLQWEILLNRPVIMELYPTNYQCSRFVICDGYYNGLFHINFNVGTGALAIQGWYGLHDIPAMGTNWSLSQSALIGLKPETMHVYGEIMDDVLNLLMPGSINGVTTDENGIAFFSVPKQWLSLHATTTVGWGNVNSTDALGVLKHSVMLSMLTGLRKLCADVNGDNNVNSIDALLIMKRFVGMINSFPSGDWIHEPVIINSDTTVTIRMRAIGDIN
jgi:hypothetical protein